LPRAVVKVGHRDVGALSEQRRLFGHDCGTILFQPLLEMYIEMNRSLLSPESRILYSVSGTLTLSRFQFHFPRDIGAENAVLFNSLRRSTAAVARGAIGRHDYQRQALVMRL